jgi:streptomycin 3"-adenylyltransferase
MRPVHRRPEAVTDRLAAHLAGRASGHLVAVYLHGSAVLGGWVAARSDIDVLVVASNDTDEPAADLMAQRILEVADDQAPAIECSIVTVAAARDPGPPWPFLRHVNSAGPERIVRPDESGGDRDLLMHYAVCRVAGHRALGPLPRDLIGPVQRADILAYLADELFWGLAHAPERYGVLNACRAQMFLADGAIVSKVAGAESALQRGTGPADVINRALAQQLGAQPDQPPAPDAVDFVLAVAAMLQKGDRTTPW